MIGDHQISVEDVLGSTIGYAPEIIAKSGQLGRKLLGKGGQEWYLLYFLLNH